jgi:broad specificity phosphatase PhoE
MKYLILVRHSNSEIDPTLPAAQWNLSSAGRQRCILLAEKIRKYAPARVITSTEPKAIQTGNELAKVFNLPHSEFSGLHEHDRQGVAHMDREIFENNVARFFAQSDEIVFGRESAATALQRFSASLQAAISRFPRETVAVISHGTVISLWASAMSGDEPFPLWKQLGMPAALVFSRPDLELVELIENVD